MKKQVFLMLLGSSFLLTGCGNKGVIFCGKNLVCDTKSSIDVEVKAQRLAEAYGDGKYVHQDFFLPLTDRNIDAIPSLVPNAGPILSGIARTFMNIGAGGFGLGKMPVRLTQPVPEIPSEYVKDIRLKRVFFYIEPHENNVRNHNAIYNFIHGKSNVDFDFLSKIAISVSSNHIPNLKDYYPVFDKSPKEDQATMDRFENYFKKQTALFPTFVNPEKAKDLLILKYDRSNRKDYLKNDEYGDMYLARVNNASAAVKTQEFLKNHPKLKGAFVGEINLLNSTLMIELRKDPIISEIFKQVISEESSMLEKLGVSQLEACTYKTCMDLRLPDVGLLDVATRDNSIQLDAFIDADKVPEGFQLKGFVEFSTLIDSPI